MIILKYIVLSFLFLSTSLIGTLVSKKYRTRVVNLKEFKEVCNILESKIKFTYEPLGDIFKEIISMLKNESIRKILESTTENLKNNDFNLAWESAVEKQKEILNFKDEDISIIKRLGNMLGKTDVDGQISEINLTKEFLDTQIQEAEIECRKNEKMYRSLGTIFGLAIVIILV